MPFKERCVMQLRFELCEKANKAGANIRELCREYNVSPTTAYKWINRYRDKQLKGLKNKSKRPKTSPSQTPIEVERDVLAIRQTYPYWGARKIHAIMERKNHKCIPSTSTITAILKRYGYISPETKLTKKTCQRFEYPNPNDLWQMDFKGEFKTAKGICYPLTVTDDHSRYSLAVSSLSSQRGELVKATLTTIFKQNGIPKKMLMDNGPPWGGHYQGARLSKFSVWLIDLGIKVVHGRPYHPQTQGKEERFHRTLKRECISQYQMEDLENAQYYFDKFRKTYNHIRPHEAINMAVPASRYRKSNRDFTDKIGDPVYHESDSIRAIHTNGCIRFKTFEYYITEALSGKNVAIRIDSRNDQFARVYYRHHLIRIIDLKKGSKY